MTAPITVSSLEDLGTHLAPSSPSEYLRYLIITTLRRKGFEGAEAGALTEMERLLEHHVQRLFVSANQHAQFANRTQPNTFDLLSAQDEALEARRMKRESKKKRAALKLPIINPPSDVPPPSTTLDLLVDYAAESSKENIGSSIDRRNPEEVIDKKPTFTDLNQGGGPSTPQPNSRIRVYGWGGQEEETDTAHGIMMRDEEQKVYHRHMLDDQGRKKIRMGHVPEYAYDWAPGVPPKWMYISTNSVEPTQFPEVEAPPKVTSGAMDFVKSTTVVGENIPPELGIVHFLKTGDRAKRRHAGLQSEPSGDTIQL